MKNAVEVLADYGIEKGLISEDDRLFCINRFLNTMRLDTPESLPDSDTDKLPDVLKILTDDAVSRGVIEDGITSRDLFDTELMTAMTPFPHEVRNRFCELYAESPEKATDWYYEFSQATNYIRRDRIEKDRKWKYTGKYGTLDITINLSKPEKDPRAIAAARLAAQTEYPKCQLCAENEGYAGRMNHPARGNHRPVPVTIDGADWFLQYSPYVYYNEHCIVFNAEHIPMVINKSAFRKLLDFVTVFPHYFIGSNADLPIVGGSILSHEHFQGGNYEFAMAKAPVQQQIQFPGFEDVSAGIVDWPLSVIRLRAEDRERLAELADRILTAWRGYTDEDAFIYAETDGEPHNTITPIARRRGTDYELDLVLRNNITTEEHPLGVYHPHAKLHHIKKENIGLIEVMGLAVLPARLKNELDMLEQAMLSGKDFSGDPVLGKHAEWTEEIRSRRTVTEDNVRALLEDEVGRVFEQVLEDAGVYKHTAEGAAAFLRFLDSVR